MIVFTYERTSRGVSRPDDYIQGLLLISVVAATVMLAIGDSLARGLGMLGALSIIRFRTTLQNPRNIVFMFASIGAGIAVGVYGFVVGMVGTIGFCLAAFILRFSPFSRDNNLTGTLKLELPQTAKLLQQVEWILGQFCEGYELKKYKIFTRLVDVPLAPAVIGAEPVQAPPQIEEYLIEYEYRIQTMDEGDAIDLSQALREIEEIKNVRLNFSETLEVI